MMEYNMSAVSASNSTSYLDAGIHDNVYIVDVKYDTTVKGNEFLAVYVENQRGDKCSLTEWPTKPFGNKSLDQLTDQEKENLKNTQVTQMFRIKEILKLFVSEEEANYSASSFKDWAEKAVRVLGDKYKKVPLRVKVVFDKKGYTTIANKGRHPFIEPMTVPKEETRIRILPGDIMSRPQRIKADKEKVEANPLDETVSTAVPSNDMPF